MGSYTPSHDLPLLPGLQIFLERLLSVSEKKGPFSVPLLEQIDSVLKLTSVKNCEIRLRWHLLCLKAGEKSVSFHSRTTSNPAALMVWPHDTHLCHDDQVPTSSSTAPSTSSPLRSVRTTSSHENR